MKKRVALYIAVIAFFSASFTVYCRFREGQIHSMPFAKSLYPVLQMVVSRVTDLKFQFRGATPKKQNIVIIGIDADSLNRLGRWPWRRDIIALLVHQLIGLGVKTVGIDVLFPETMSPVNEELRDILLARGDDALLSAFDFDQKLASVVKKYRDRIVMEWYSESPCRKGLGDCTSGVPPELPEGFSKFAIKVRSSSQPTSGRQYSAKAKSMWLSTEHVAAPFPSLYSQLQYLGFPNVIRDRDGIARTSSLVMEVNGHLYPSFPLTLASNFSDREVSIGYDLAGNSPRASSIDQLNLGTDRTFADRIGNLEINFRGPEGTYPHIPVWQVLEWAESKPDRDLAATDGREVLRGSLAIIGATAYGLGDTHATPFDSTTPGVEIIANITDNLLTQDGFRVSPLTHWLLFFLMTVGASIFLFAGEKLEARQFGAVVFGVFFAFMFWDFAILFPQGVNAPTAFFYLEMLALTAICLTVKYLAEEQKRKFIRLAFSKYVSPKVVDSLIEDNRQLSLGGRRENLTILFLDIRGFTTFSEHVDAKTVSQFLNEFLGLMTDTIFKYGGTLDKYIGDAVMAFWGAPLAQPDHAFRALTAAIEMQKVLEASLSGFEKSYSFRPKIGIGLHTGMVSVGNMGSERSFGYTVIGDPVNLASRIEGATKYFGAPILTTRDTLREVLKSGNLVPEHRVIGPVRTKGKNTAVEVVEILTAPLPTQVAADFESGKSAFRLKRWAEAKRFFAQASAHRGGDGPSDYYLALCDEISSSDLAEDWDGSWSLTEK